jgi:putative SOS response-associated peptidase YedK
MCSFYNLKVNHHQILDWCGVSLDQDFPETVAVKQLGLALKLDDDGKRQLIPMRFGLIPAGAKSLDQYKPAYNNARFENLDKWPWKLSLATGRCVVPLTSFREPCYWGPTAGSMVNFCSPKRSILGVAAICQQFQSPGADLWSMTMIMRPASEYVMENGHQRQPFFIYPDGFDEWLSGRKDLRNCRSTLARWCHEPELSYRDQVPMRPGWEKRQPAALKKRESELGVIERLGSLGIKV